MVNVMFAEVQKVFDNIVQKNIAEGKTIDISIIKSQLKQQVILNSKEKTNAYINSLLSYIELTEFNISQVIDENKSITGINELLVEQKEKEVDLVYLLNQLKMYTSNQLEEFDITSTTYGIPNTSKENLMIMKKHINHLKRTYVLI